MFERRWPKSATRASLTPWTRPFCVIPALPWETCSAAQGDYEAALKAYSTAVIRYQNCPEVLEAYVQIADAYRNLNKPQEAKDALEQAKFALARMKPDAAFETTTNYTRKEWAQRLDLLSTL